MSLMPTTAPTAACPEDPPPSSRPDPHDDADRAPAPVGRTPSSACRTYERRRARPIRRRCGGRERCVGWPPREILLRTPCSPARHRVHPRTTARSRSRTCLRARYAAGRGDHEPGRLPPERDEGRDAGAADGIRSSLSAMSSMPEWCSSPSLGRLGPGAGGRPRAPGAGVTRRCTSRTPPPRP